MIKPKRDIKVLVVESPNPTPYMTWDCINGDVNIFLNREDVLDWREPWLRTFAWVLECERLPRMERKRILQQTWRKIKRESIQNYLQQFVA